MQKDIINESFINLKSYCETENFKGWDPFDGLNSKVFKSLQLFRIRFFRLVWIQFFKRNPVNLRTFFGVPKEYNPKGLGLFLTGFCNLYTDDPKEEYLEQIDFLAKKLIELRTKGFSGACWGYNFDWQNRTFFLPKGTPTIVATSFIASALLDAYDITKNKSYFDIAMTSADFVIKDLNRTYKKEGFIFSYSPFDKTKVYNASLLGSKLLSRIYSYNNDKVLINVARGSVIACANMQQKNGAWAYGEHEVQDWIDSFHTGYNLECISEYQKYSGDDSFNKNLEKGLKYYLDNFFLKEGIPKYYNNRIYPIDIHAPAQLIITLYRLNLLNDYKNLANRVLIWTIEHMQDTKNGYFYYQIKKGISSKIPYMRWAQAWMFYAFSFYILENERFQLK